MSSIAPVAAVVGMGSQEATRHECGSGGATPDPLNRHLNWRKPVYTSLTDDEHKELSDKVREANKRSESGSGRR